MQFIYLLVCKTFGELRAAYLNTYFRTHVISTLNSNTFSGALNEFNGFECNRLAVSLLLFTFLSKLHGVFVKFGGSTELQNVFSLANVTAA